MREIKFVGAHIMKRIKDFIKDYKKDILLLLCLIIILVVVASSTLSFTGFWSGVNNASLLLGELTFLFSFMTWASTRKKEADIRRKRAEELKNEKVNQVGLVIYVDNIQNYEDVKAYLRCKDNRLTFLMENSLLNESSYSIERGGMKVAAEKSLISISLPRMPQPKDCGNPTAAEEKEMEQFFINYSEVLDFVRKHLKTSGIQLVHLFNATPISLSTFTGAAFNNQLSVIGYQFANDKTASIERKYYRTYDRTFESYLSEII